VWRPNEDLRAFWTMRSYRETRFKLVHFTKMLFDAFRCENEMLKTFLSGRPSHKWYSGTDSGKARAEESL